MFATPMIQQDIRDMIFAGISGNRYTAYLVTEREGILVGVHRLKKFLQESDIGAEFHVADGDFARMGEILVTINGTPKQIAVAEEFVIGFLAKPSGIATAARKAVDLAGPELKVVCGAWKKMPPELKHVVREAVAIGGASFRITDQPFLYLDKNFVRMLGGVQTTLKAVAGITDKQKVIQLKQETCDIAADALTAVQNGANILMIDTGDVEDVTAVNRALKEAGLRKNVKIAFAKGVKIEDLPKFIGLGIDIVDIGTSIIDAPLLDMKMEVQG